MGYYKILQKKLRDPEHGNLQMNLVSDGGVDPGWMGLPDTALSAELWDNSVTSSQPWNEYAFTTVKFNIGALGPTQFVTLNVGTIWDAKQQIENMYEEQAVNFSSFIFVAWNQKIE